jgi:Cdc6-like AAA superfamily ATPase
MKWAEKRTTTEEEDIVYCLLRLLDIEMPITYGEGQESARRRLQAEIEANGSEPSIILFSRNESFVGCKSQLAQLKTKLFSNDQTTTTLVIVGLGGTGKLQLALKVVHRTRLNNKSCSVFWIDASDMNSIYWSYASVARKLRIPGYNDDQADIKQVVKHCVAEVSTRQCLLIFDNVKDITIRSSSSLSISEAADLSDVLPHSKLYSVIFTTIESETAKALAPRNVTALQELTPDAALRMLQNRLTSLLSNAEQQTVVYLLRELSYLPLAVIQIAACINASEMTVQQYQVQLDEHKRAASKYNDNLSKGELRESGSRDIVAATLSLSMR